MALNIANRKVEEKTIRASRILGVNKTAAVEFALDYYFRTPWYREGKQSGPHGSSPFT